MAAQQFCLKWNNHTNNMLEIFNTLLSTEALVDVTLACDGLSLKAHKIVLSACSPFFQSLFLENPCQHPIVIMKDIPYKDLKAIVDFMYRGEVNVSQDQLSGLLRTAETLKVKGLADENRGVQQEVSTSQNSVVPPSTSTSTSQQRRADSPPLHAKRKKGRPRKRSLSDSNRSDDEMGPAKIKEPNSPEIEELSEDAILDEGRSDSMIRQRSSSSQRRIRSSVNTSFSSKSLTPSNAHIEEPPSGEEEFELEPSKLLEQTLTTDAASSVSNTALTSTMPVNFNLPSSSGIEISQIGSDSQALVPVAGTSDSSHLQGPDSPPDIKPTITTFDESQSDSMMYMDQSSLPGPSNYQDNSMMQGDEQPQGDFSLIEDKCVPVFPKPSSYDTKSISNWTSASTNPWILKKYSCTACDYCTNKMDHLKRHAFIHSGVKPFKCFACDRSFSRKDKLKKHLLSHKDKFDNLSCKLCLVTFQNPPEFEKHVLQHSGPLAAKN